jgi:hypothetical protein
METKLQKELEKWLKEKKQKEKEKPLTRLESEAVMYMIKMRSKDS